MLWFSSETCNNLDTVSAEDFLRPLAPSPALLWYSLAGDCHPSKASILRAGVLPSQLQPSQPCQCLCFNWCGLSRIAREGSFPFPFLIFPSNGKSSCLPLGAEVFSTTSTKSSGWEFSFWLPLREQTDMLGCYEIRLELLSIFIDFIFLRWVEG